MTSGPAAQQCRDEGILAKVKAPEREAASRWTRADWIGFLVFGRRPEPFPSFTGVVEPAAPEKIGIACSGGGIRSAAFNLGALQEMQRAGLLAKTCYLAGVSGGAYIASAFCMVAKRGHPNDSDPTAVNSRHPPFEPGSPEEQYLRNRSSYMAPGGNGMLRLGYRVLLGMAFNLLFISLCLLVVALPMAMLYGWIYPDLAHHLNGDGMCDGPCGFTPLTIPSGVYLPTIAIAMAALVIGAAAMVAYLWPPRWRDAAETLSLRLLMLAVGAAVLLIGLPVLLSLVRGLGVDEEALSSTSSAKAPLPIAGTGIVAAALALVLQLRAQVADTASELVGAAKWYRELSARLQRGLAFLVAGIAGPLFVLLLVLVAMSATLNRPDVTERWIGFGVLGALFLVAYVFADLTTWSLHPFYRRRLESAFALRRIRRPGRPPIGNDDIGEAEARPSERRVLLSETAVDPDADGNRWPSLIVCAAANISDDAATPPGRTVTSFTFSATAMGGPLIGAVGTADFERACGRRRQRAFTLPAAVAMSGAALSPTMGKQTRRPLRFLLALANVRLGVWVPNPRRIETFNARNHVYPRPRPSYLLRELLGRNRINAPFLYVTDGGHYDNLGLVELARRGCTEVYCFDASNDGFEALGDAVSLSRSELQVDIDIDHGDLRPNRKTGVAKRNCVDAEIAYPGDDAPLAKLYYARCVMTADVPEDVRVYHQSDPRFPQDPTFDQLYHDDRFEAYRALGRHAARNALVSAGRAART